MRVESSIKNLKYSYILKATSMLLHLVTRVVFIKYLSVELLGANGLFSNIIGILSFADLGIGAAITFSLYKPLEQQDHEKIKTLIHLYRVCYSIAGTCILVVGLCLIPFLPSLTNHSTLPNLNLIYVMFLLVTVVSYYAADKQSLLIADQKQYMVSLISLGFEVRTVHPADCSHCTDQKLHPVSRHSAALPGGNEYHAAAECSEVLSLSERRKYSEAWGRG